MVHSGTSDIGKCCQAFLEVSVLQSTKENGTFGNCIQQDRTADQRKLQVREEKANANNIGKETQYTVDIYM